jgi:excisionase family DNA binding protein
MPGPGYPETRRVGHLRPPEVGHLSTGRGNPVTKKHPVRVYERLRQLVAALPSDSSSVVLTRRDLVDLLEGDDVGPSADTFTADMTVLEVAETIGRSPSTVRAWLIDGSLRGYKLNRRDWSVPRSALRDYLDGQMAASAGTVEPHDQEEGRHRRMAQAPRTPASGTKAAMTLRPQALARATLCYIGRGSLAPGRLRSRSQVCSSLTCVRKELSQGVVNCSRNRGCARAPTLCARSARDTS